MNEDYKILRELASACAEAAAAPCNEERRIGWRRVNDLERHVKPMLWINEEPWEELNTDGSLTLQCRDPYLRQVEDELRRTLYRWRHFPGDLIVDGVIGVTPVTNYDEFCGMNIQEQTIAHDPRGGIVSHHYDTQFHTLDDVEKIQMITIRYDREETERRLRVLREAVGDIMPVELRKYGFLHFSPWDKIAMWYNPMELLMDLVLKGDLMHAIVGRYTEAMLHQLDQLDALNLLGRTDNNQRIGSGGLGFVSDLPGRDYDPEHIHPINQWGNAMPQIFSDVSPEMHEEFALQYDRRWLERFGLSYYGCCEPLHQKLGILKSVRNLRKISVSPWADLEKMVEGTQGRYVLSIKPSPAFLAEDRWRPEQVRQDIRRKLEMIGDLPCEFILKDISTCREQPERITEYLQIIREEVEK